MTNEFIIRRNHINGIENFWRLSKVRLTKFRVVNKDILCLHIKECEFRYPNRNKNLYLYLSNILRKKLLSCLNPKSYFMSLITRDHLGRWADDASAKSTFPQLISRLVRATTPIDTKITIPWGSATYIGG